MHIEIRRKNDGRSANLDNIVMLGGRSNKQKMHRKSAVLGINTYDDAKYETQKGVCHLI